MNTLNLLKKIFSFPRNELENHWWHRLLKVAIIVSTIVIFLFSIQWANQAFKPYNVYSFQNDFTKYSLTYRVRNCSLNDFCGADADDIVFKFYLTNPKDTYNIFSKNYDAHVAIQQMEKDGLLNNLKAVDLQNNFYGTYYRVLYIILLPIIWYLILSQVLYRIIVYILVGKKVH